MADQPCKVCKQIRIFLSIAIPLLVIIGTQPNIAVPTIPVEEIFTNFIAVAFLAVLGYRIYVDYFKKKK